jgi:hypothetical protein
MFGWSEINVETVAGLTGITDIFPVRAAGEIAALAGLVAQRTSTAKLNAKDRVITFHNKQFRDFTKDLQVGCSGGGTTRAGHLFKLPLLTVEPTRYRTGWQG